MVRMLVTKKVRVLLEAQCVLGVPDNMQFTTSLDMIFGKWPIQEGCEDAPDTFSRLQSYSVGFSHIQKAPDTFRKLQPHLGQI